MNFPPVAPIPIWLFRRKVDKESKAVIYNGKVDEYLDRYTKSHERFEKEMDEFTSKLTPEQYRHFLYCKELGTVSAMNFQALQVEMGKQSL